MVTNQLEVRKKEQQLVGKESGYEDNTAVERLDSNQTVEGLVLEGNVCLCHPCYGCHCVTSVLVIVTLCCNCTGIRT